MNVRAGLFQRRHEVVAPTPAARQRVIKGLPRRMAAGSELAIWFDDQLRRR